MLECWDEDEGLIVLLLCLFLCLIFCSVVLQVRQASLATAQTGLYTLYPLQLSSTTSCKYWTSSTTSQLPT